MMASSPSSQTADEEYYPQEHSPFQRSHRHTTSLTSFTYSKGIYPQTNVERSRAATLAPTLPPKQKKPQQESHKELQKTQSLENWKSEMSASRRRRVESPYISVEDITSFPDMPRNRSLQQSIVKPAVENKETRPPPITSGIKQRQNNLNSIQRLNARAKSPVSSVGLPPSSPTRFLVNNNQSDSLYTVPQKKDDSKHFRPISPSRIAVNLSPKPHSTEFNFAENIYQSSEQHPIPQHSMCNSIATQSNRNYENTTIGSELSQAPPPKKEVTFVADFNKIQHRLFRLYRKIEESPENSPMITDLKTRLRLSEHDSAEIVIEKIHMSLAPPQDDDIKKKMMYVVDFRSFRDKFELRHQIIEMFAKPGPPSISYAKVDAKMDSIIAEFCIRVVQLRETQGKLMESPAHARMILHGVSDGEQLVKALRDNQLWIRWGTVSNLPPLYHLYLHKHPPSYEVRKAVTISFVAERLKAMPDMMNNVTSEKVLCPPIYSRLKHESGKTKWQVTEYNASSGKFDSHECQLPSWLDDDSTVNALLNSSNRTVFELGNHPYALYSVYVVIIKDFTLAQEGTSRNSDKDSSWATPSKIQFYIGSSSTGVLYRFAHVENSHCDRIWKVLSEATSLRHFRCYEGCDLVEACLALAWARRQPRAVFVLNSFLSKTLSSLSLEQKEPFKEKMLTLASHLTDGKKIGPLCDMRYGMNGTTTIQEDEDY